MYPVIGQELYAVAAFQRPAIEVDERELFMRPGRRGVGVDLRAAPVISPHEVAMPTPQRDDRVRRTATLIRAGRPRPTLVSGGRAVHDEREGLPILDKRPVGV